MQRYSAFLYALVNAHLFQNPHPQFVMQANPDDLATAQFSPTSAKTPPKIDSQAVLYSLWQVSSSSQIWWKGPLKWHQCLPALYGACAVGLNRQCSQSIHSTQRSSIVKRHIMNTRGQHHHSPPHSLPAWRAVSCIQTNLICQNSFNLTLYSELLN